MIAFSPVAIVACTVAYMVLGFLWYSPLMFSKPWTRMTGLANMSKDAMNKKMAFCLFLSVVQGIMMATVLSVLFSHVPLREIVLGAILLWFAFIGLTMGVNYAYANRPFALWAIDAGYSLAAMIIMAVLISTLG